MWTSRKDESFLPVLFSLKPNRQRLLILAIIVFNRLQKKGICQNDCIFIMYFFVTSELWTG